MFSEAQMQLFSMLPSCTLGRICCIHEKIVDYFQHLLLLRICLRRAFFISYPWYIGQVENSWAFVPTSLLSQVNIKLWSDKSEIHQISQMFSICAPNYYLLDSTLTQILFIHTHTFLWYRCSSINRRMLWVPRWS